MLVSVKLIKYLVSAVIVITFDPSIVPLPTIKISFFLVSTCQQELLSTLNIITCLPNLAPPNNEKNEHELNSIPFEEYEYLSGSAFSVNLTALN